MSNEWEALLRRQMADDEDYAAFIAARFQPRGFPTTAAEAIAAAQDYRAEKQAAVDEQLELGAKRGIFVAPEQDDENGRSTN